VDGGRRGGGDQESVTGAVVAELDQERGSRSLNSFAENLRRKHEGGRTWGVGEWRSVGIGAFRGSRYAWIWREVTGGQSGGFWGG
jgi:hypothetical protein